jgi:hypothetical protein
MAIRYPLDTHIHMVRRKAMLAVTNLQIRHLAISQIVEPLQALTSHNFPVHVCLAPAKADRNHRARMIVAALLALMTKRVGVALRLQRLNAVVRSSSGPGQFMLWQIAR